jgi:hypothetical protein
MLNWLNRQKASIAATAVAYPQPHLADWRNRGHTGINRNGSPQPDLAVPRKRRIRRLELLSIAVVIALIVGVDLYIFGINKRLSALESEFVEVKAWAFPASLLEGKYTSLNARVRALTEAYSGLNEKLVAVSAQQLPVGVAEATQHETLANIEPEAAGAAEMTDGAALAVTETDTPPEQPPVTAVTQVEEHKTLAYLEPEAAGLSDATDMMARAEIAKAAPAGAEDAARAMTEADIPTDAPAAGLAGPAARNTPVSAITSGLVRRVDEETHAAVSSSEPLAVSQSARSGYDASEGQQSMEALPAPAAGVQAAVTADLAPATASQPSLASRTAGPWVINLLSDPNEGLAARFAEKARGRGVPVEQSRTEVKGRVYWRVQITGFDTAREAQGRAEEVKEKLHLKDVWVFKQRG